MMDFATFEHCKTSKFQYHLDLFSAMMQTIPALFILLLCYSCCDACGKTIFKANITKAAVCSDSNSVVTVNSWKINPSNFTFPGNVSVSFDVQVKQEIASPVQVQTSQFFEVLFFGLPTGIWLPQLLCINETIGTCSIADICPILAKYNSPSKPCPEPLRSLGLPCNCPIPAGNYKVTNATFPVPAIDTGIIPAFLLSGNYFNKAVATVGATKTPVGCGNLTITMSK